MNHGKALRAGQALLDGAGIDDRLTVIGAFAPRGRALRQFVGMDAGSIAGDAIGGVIGEAIGTLAGGRAGADYGEQRTGLPPRVFLAAGRHRGYAFGAGKHGGVPLTYLATLPSGGRIRVRRRVTVRVVEFRDRTGQPVLEVEGPYGPFYRCKRTITAITLLGSGSPQSADRA